MKGEQLKAYSQDILVFYKKTAKNEKVLPYLMRVEKVVSDFILPLTIANDASKSTGINIQKQSKKLETLRGPLPKVSN